MLKNYWLIALRLLIKNKVFSVINILGLSIGISCCILITLYLQDEFSYEKGFKDVERIFRINTSFIREGVKESSGFTSPPIAMELAQSLPEIEVATRVVKPLNVEQHIVWYKDKSFFESRVILVDSTFLDVFSFELMEGRREGALSQPSTVLLSKKLKEKIFGHDSALDELLIVNSGTSADTFRVTGVVAPLSHPSHLEADLYLSMNSNGWGQWVLGQTTWTNNNLAGGYLKLKDPSLAAAVEGKLPQQMELHAGEELRQSGRQKILSLQPIESIRLHSEKKDDDKAVAGNITSVYIIGTIGALILLLACINFMNLTTAKSAQRAAEVGIRKSMGAMKGNLIGQFIGESMIIVLFSLLVSSVIVLLVLPWFNQTMEKEISLSTGNLPLIAISALGIAIVTGLLAGSYPALFLSSLQPTKVLKGKTLTGDGSQWLRKGLVVFQFVITITLISSILIIQQQLSYIQNKSLGFNAKQVIMVPLRTQLASQQYVALKDAFGEIPGVSSVSASSSVPSTPLARDWSIFKEGSSNDKSIRHEIVNVDQHYFKTMNIPIVEGRDFDINSDNLASDTTNLARVIVNEASLSENGIPPGEAIGSSLIFEPDPGQRYIFNIVGVVKNFHQFSLHNKISPMMFILPGERTSFPYLAVSVDMRGFEGIQQQMKKHWDERVNDAPFESIFLNENVKKMYLNERRTSTILTFSTVIAVVISSLGLYGLSAYIAERKTKEIGIRKVAGASVRNIVEMLSKEYVVLIIISFAISIPIGWYFMNEWLQSFAYHIDPTLSVFLISGVISFLIAWITISFESFRAANRNPIETLRGN